MGGMEENRKAKTRRKRIIAESVEGRKEEKRRGERTEGRRKEGNKALSEQGNKDNKRHF